MALFCDSKQNCMPWNSWFLEGLQNQKRPLPGDRALQTEQKSVLHQSPNFSGL